MIAARNGYEHLACAGRCLVRHRFLRGPYFTG
jgi:hypothetical protein